MQTFASWVASVGDQDAIPPDDPIFDWAHRAGIPGEFLDLAWMAFVDRYVNDAKRYADWRAVFLNAVRGNWQKDWCHSPPAGYCLSTIGEQYRRVRDADDESQLEDAA